MFSLNKNTILLALSLLLCGIAECQSFTISGSVIDSTSGETLIGAAVMDLRSGKGALTNAQGRFSLTLHSDSITLRITYVGYKPIFEEILPKSNVKRTYKLQRSTELKTVVVQADRIDNAKSSQMSAIQVPIERLKSIPVLFGEADLVKALQLLPGVQSGTPSRRKRFSSGPPPRT